jgi:hypothetical protein
MWPEEAGWPPLVDAAWLALLLPVAMKRTTARKTRLPAAAATDVANAGSHASGVSRRCRRPASATDREIV